MALAFGQSRSSELLGKGDAARIAQTGLAEAAVFLQKIKAYGDPRLFALSLVGEQISKSVQPLVPERLLMTGAGGDGGLGTSATGLFGQLLALLLSEKAGIAFGDKDADTQRLQMYAEELMKKGDPRSPDADGGKALAADLDAELGNGTEKSEPRG